MSPAPATVTDEMVELARGAFRQWVRGFDRLHIPIGTINGCGQEIGTQVTREMLEASVGPALARLQALEKMEQRAQDARVDMKSRQNSTNASEEGVQIALYVECVLNHILTGSDAEKGKT